MADLQLTPNTSPPGCPVSPGQLLLTPQQSESTQGGGFVGGEREIAAPGEACSEGRGKRRERKQQRTLQQSELARQQH
jgi:hypothetical protein